MFPLNKQLVGEWKEVGRFGSETHQGKDQQQNQGGVRRDRRRGGRHLRQGRDKGDRHRQQVEAIVQGQLRGRRRRHRQFQEKIARVRRGRRGRRHDRLRGSGEILYQGKVRAWETKPFRHLNDLIPT